jgi:hypothetical protein
VFVSTYVFKEGGEVKMARPQVGFSATLFKREVWSHPCRYNMEMKFDVPLIQKHGAFEALLLPFAAIVMIHTDMTELIKNRHNRGVSTTQNLEIMIVSRCRRHPHSGRFG